MPRATWEDIRRAAAEAELHYDRLAVALESLRAMGDSAGRSDVSDEVRFHARVLRRMGLIEELRSMAK